MGDDFTEKTTIVSGDTLGSHFQRVGSAPPSLQVLIGPTAIIGKQYFLEGNEYIIGRNPDCKIFIDDRSVSRSHAKIQVTGEGVFVSDLGSANKTFIKEAQLQANLPFKLANGDQIKCGNVIFKFLEQGSVESYTNQTLMERAMKDPLTGAYTKRALLERGPEVVKRSQNLKENLSVLVFDIDFFKKVNDRYGHPGGDYVLKELGRLVQSQVIRSEDFFARYGGEEFVLVLLNANITVAQEVAERLRLSIQSHIFNYQGSIIPVTISVGAAQRQSSDHDWDVLFNRADTALYRSKQEGRNRVTLG